MGPPPAIFRFPLQEQANATSNNARFPSALFPVPPLPPMNETDRIIDAARLPYLKRSASTDSLVKKTKKVHINPTPQNVPAADKENLTPRMFEPVQELPSPIARLKALEDSPIGGYKTSTTLSPMPIPIPEPHEMPPIEDDGEKPAYSYASLIGMAILRAPNRRMTLNAIYTWIGDNFAYYRASESGWQNSIRHNLSLNKAFVKQNRPKEEPGKGNYWTIEQGCESQFIKNRLRKINTMPTGIISARKKPVASPMSDRTLSSPLTPRHSEQSPLSRESHVLEASSDPSMDNRLRENELPKHAKLGFTMVTPQRSKAKADDFEDSGFFEENSTPSTVPIKKPNGPEGYGPVEVPSSMPPVCYLSPPLSSSPPLRPTGNIALLPPLTPATTLRPKLPPSSVSPQTTLRNHRSSMLRFLTSPARSICVAEDDPWAQTPRTMLPDFVDDPDDVASRLCFGSPNKREAKRRELRRGMLSGLHPDDFFSAEEMSGVASVFGVDVCGVMRREVERVHKPSLTRSYTR